MTVRPPAAVANVEVGTNSEGESGESTSKLPHADIGQHSPFMQCVSPGVQLHPVAMQSPFIRDTNGSDNILSNNHVEGHSHMTTMPHVQHLMRGMVSNPTAQLPRDERISEGGYQRGAEVPSPFANHHFMWLYGLQGDAPQIPLPTSPAAWSPALLGWQRSLLSPPFHRQDGSMDFGQPPISPQLHYLPNMMDLPASPGVWDHTLSPIMSPGPQFFPGSRVVQVPTPVVMQFPKLTRSASQHKEQEDAHSLDQQRRMMQARNQRGPQQSSPQARQLRRRVNKVPVPAPQFPPAAPVPLRQSRAAVSTPPTFCSLIFHEKKIVSRGWDVALLVNKDVIVSIRESAPRLQRCLENLGASVRIWYKRVFAENFSPPHPKLSDECRDHVCYITADTKDVALQVVLLVAHFGRDIVYRKRLQLDNNSGSAKKASSYTRTTAKVVFPDCEELELELKELLERMEVSYAWCRQTPTVSSDVSPSICDVPLVSSLPSAGVIRAAFSSMGRLLEDLRASPSLTENREYCDDNHKVFIASGHVGVISSVKCSPAVFVRILLQVLDKVIDFNRTRLLLEKTSTTDGLQAKLK